MATVAVTADNTRVAVATIATDSGTWGNDGGGGGVADEPDIVYQGTTAQSRKVGSTLIGRSYTHGSGTDMDGTPANTAHYIAKLNMTNYAALNTRTTPGSELKVGSGSSAYHSYYLYGSDNYPAKGGFQIIAVAPSVSGYASAVGDTGSPNDSSILYWSWLGDFTGTSKAENVVIDAIDVGLGLCLVGGDGASPDGVFDDFVSADEGTSTNRWGFVFTVEGVLFWTGQMCIGQTSAGTSTATVFQDSGKTVVWTNGLVTTGFHRMLIDLATSGTDIDMTNCSFGSQGQEDNDGDRGYTTTEDSRTILEVTGSHASASLALNACVIDNFAGFTLNSRVTLDTCVITNCGQIDCGSGATIAGTSISSYTGDPDTGAVLWNNANDPNGELDDLTFDASGDPNACHAIEFGTSAPQTMTLTRHDYGSDYNASDGQNDSTLLFPDTGSDVTWNVTINDGDTPSYKKARTGDTVNILSNVIVTFDTLKDNTEVRIYNNSTGAEIDGIENATAGTTDDRNFGASVASGTVVDYVIHAVGYEYIRVEAFTWPASAQTINIAQRVDRNYSNP